MWVGFGMYDIPVVYICCIEWHDEGGARGQGVGEARHFLEKHGHGGLDPRKASVNRFVKARVGIILGLDIGNLHLYVSVDM